MTYPVDWSQVVLELRKAGYSDRMQAELTGMSTMTIWRMAQGMVEPRWGAGTEMLLQHRLLTRRDPPMLAEVA